MDDWLKKALCAEIDPELFFPEVGGNSRNARRMCSRCEVKTECLNEALKDSTLMGIWGGTNQKERKLIRSKK